MECFESSLEIVAAPDVVMATFWRPERWPAVAAHVRSVDIVYDDENVQVLRFAVGSDARVDHFKSVRVRHRDRILFYQPDPPGFLEVHSGRWDFRATSRGTAVTVLHRVAINRAAARGVPAFAGLDDPRLRQRVISLITGNSLQTMRALKQLIEHAKEHADARPDTQLAVH